MCIRIRSRSSVVEEVVVVVVVATAVVGVLALKFKV